MIRITVDTASFAAQMDDFAKNQLPYATMKALNTTATDFQSAEQGHIAQNFTLRRVAFMLRQVRIDREDWATKEKLETVIKIDPNRNILGKFEEGGTKTSRNPQGSIAIPIEAKTSKADIVLASNRPKAFMLVTQNTKGGYSIAKGLKRVFLIEGPDGKGEIFQRVGTGKSSKLRLLYDLEKSVPIPAMLDFIPTARRIVAENFPRNFAAAFALAMNTAKR
jgi:hypothetical protein